MTKRQQENIDDQEVTELTDVKRDNKASHKAAKKLRLERQAQRPHHDIVQQAKRLWEQVRKNAPASERAVVVTGLIQALKGHVQDVIFKHDASRIIQSALKFGSSEQRDTIARELEGRFVHLAQSAYGRFIVTKILKYCPNQRAQVISEFYGHVRPLMRHKQASAVLEEAFALYANATQRNSLVSEFYGSEFALFKEEGASSLSLEALLQASPEKRDAVMQHLKQHLEQLLSKHDSGCLRHSLVHRVLDEYLTFTQDATSILELVRDHWVELVHTKDGARVAQRLFALSPAKERKSMLKQLKPFVAQMATDPHAHLVLSAALGCIDDTVQTSKAILQPLLTDAEVSLTTLRDKFARRVILSCLVARWDAAYYSQESRLQLETVRDKWAQSTSKKPAEQRARELQSSVQSLLVTHFVEPSLLDKQQFVLLWQEPFLAQTLLALFQHANAVMMERVAPLIGECLLLGLENDENSFTTMWCNVQVNRMLQRLLSLDTGLKQLISELLLPKEALMWDLFCSEKEKWASMPHFVRHLQGFNEKWQTE